MIVVHPDESSGPMPDLIVVANRTADAVHPPGAITFNQPCQVCGHTTRIDAISRNLIHRHGIGIACLACALERWPGLLVGTHAGDGHVVTLAEAVAMMRDRGAAEPQAAREEESP